MKKEKKKNIIGQRIRQFRRGKGMTQADLAERINKTVEMVCHLENGAASTKISTLEDIAEVLDVETYQFFTEATDANKLRISGKLLDIFLELEDADDKTVDAIAHLIRKSNLK